MPWGKHTVGRPGSCLPKLMCSRSVFDVQQVSYSHRLLGCWLSRGFLCHIQHSSRLWKPRTTYCTAQLAYIFHYPPFFYVATWLQAWLGQRLLWWMEAAQLNTLLTRCSFFEKLKEHSTLSCFFWGPNEPNGHNVSQCSCHIGLGQMWNQQVSHNQNKISWFVCGSQKRSTLFSSSLPRPYNT